jgi:hypothetical protein
MVFYCCTIAWFVVGEMRLANLFQHSGFLAAHHNILDLYLGGALFEFWQDTSYHD